MSTISNDVLEKLSVRYRLLAKIHDGSESQAWEESALIVEELLALRKERERAEPVYQCMDDGKWYDTEKRLYDEVKENGNECRVLYTAPPAPVVPDAIPETESKDGNDIDYMEPSAIYELGKTHGWNACRAVMLNQARSVAETDTTSQQFESLAGKAVGGWIPCSERMPPENTGVLVANDAGLKVKGE
ncbi:TPA: DUF551 domain-containing protein [Cronobacter sakazakii]|uniref:DUF551 domain-containing protein n=1 Tax=Cronobacter sakazakii TaxID=28141 RepID=UPI0021B58211|nr:DUF551 domain-containing protein [Cronobacter sakazakii]UXD92163.1 DUF551 domain-containing protein [Cronobacter sakazakii]HDK7245580.1 DUF551 domain-containing protein [Cronobacter sakazakii]